MKTTSKMKIRIKSKAMLVKYNIIDKVIRGFKYLSNKIIGMHAATYDRVVLVF